MEIIARKKMIISITIDKYYLEFIYPFKNKKEITILIIFNREDHPVIRELISLFCSKVFEFKEDLIKFNGIINQKIEHIKNELVNIVNNWMKLKILNWNSFLSPETFSNFISNILIIGSER